MPVRDFDVTPTIRLSAHAVGVLPWYQYIFEGILTADRCKLTADS